MSTPEAASHVDQKQFDELLRENQELKRFNAELAEMVRLLRAKLFGRSSEQKNPEGPTPEQPHLPFGEAPVPSALPEKKTQIRAHDRRKPGRKALPPNLPRVVTIHDLGENEKNAPCGCPMKRFGKVVSERLDMIPSRMVVIQHVRYQYSKDCQCPTGVDAPAEVKTAPLPPQIIPKGIATPGLVAHVAITKFTDGVPLYRQVQQFLRLGLNINRATLVNWILLAAFACRPLIRLLQAEILAGSLINMDETKVQVMKEPGRANTTLSFMWVLRGGPPDKPGVLFRYEPTRSGTVPQELLREYRGYLQTDGYRGYETIGKKVGIIHLGCWAHVRRKFLDVVKGSQGATKTGIAQQIVDSIDGLYAVEHQAKKEGLSGDQLAARRQEQAIPIINGIKSILEERQPITPPKSLLGKAIGYAMNQWQRLVIYPEQGFLRPDNNLAENAIRPFALGRKNWLFAGSPDGAEACSIMFSLIETAKANGLEPYAYLRCLFTEIPKASTTEELRSLLPQHIDRERLKIPEPIATQP